MALPGFLDPTRRLSGRLFLHALLPAGLALLLAIGFAAWHLYQAELDRERLRLRALAADIGQNVEAANARAAQTVALMAAAHQHGLLPRHDTAAAFARQVLAEQPDFAAAYFAFLPEEGVQDPLPYWHRDRATPGMLGLDSLPASEAGPALEAGRQRLAQEGRATTLVEEPHDHQGHPMVAFLHPLLPQGRYAGLAGVDIDLSDLGEQLSALARQAEVDAMLLSAGNRVLAITPENGRGLLLRSITDTPLADTLRPLLVARHADGLIEGPSVQLPGQFFFNSFHIDTGNWLLVLRSPKQRLLDRFLGQLVSIAGVMAAAMLLAALLLRRALVQAGRRIDATVRAADLLARGSTAALPLRPRPHGAPLDEIGQMELAFGTLAEAHRGFVAVCAAMAAGDFSRRLAPRSPEDRLAAAINELAERRSAAEAGLRHAEERSRLILDSVSDGILGLDLEGRITFANREAAERLGRPEAALLGQPLCAVLRHGPAGAPPHAAGQGPVQAALAEGRAAEVLDEVLHQEDGSQQPLEYGVRPITQDGQRIGVVIALRDIAARQAAEREAAVSHARLRAILDNADMVIFIKDREGRLLLTNAAFRRLFGLTGEAEGLLTADLLPEDAAGIAAHDAEVWRSGLALKIEEKLRIGGRQRFFLTNKFLLRDASGAPAALVSIAAEITARRQVEEAMRRNQLLLEGVLQTSAAVIYAKDEEGRYLFANRAWGALAGRAPLEAIGQDDARFFPPELVEQRRVEEWLVMQSGQAREMEEAMPVEGLEEIFLTTRVPLRSAGGRIEGICAISTNITGRKRIERELSARVEELGAARRQADAMLADLAEQRRRADAANEAKSSFLAAMSHEIRTPMNGVVGMIDLLRETGLSTDQRSMIDTARDSAFALLQILDDLLDFSKIEAGRMSVELLPVSLRDVMEGVAETLLANAAKRRLRLVLFIDPEIPPRLLTDALRLRQILFNLAGNAIKFTETRPGWQGQVSLRAGLGEGAGGAPRLRISVTDNGVGMSPEVQARLFRPFTQADQSTTRRFGGTGLGLSISRSLAALLEGEISVQSAEGQGATFTLTLPLRRAPDGPTEEPDLTGLQVGALIRADDSAAIAASYAMARGAGFRRLASAAAAAEAEALDVLILEDGWPLAEREAVMRQLAARSATRFLLLDGSRLARRGQIRPDLVVVEAEPLRRTSFLQALAMVGGRASRLVPPAPAPMPVQAATPADLEAARTDGRLILVAEDNPTNRDVIRRQLALLGHPCVLVEDGEAALAELARGGYGLVLTDCHMPRMDGFALTAAIRQREVPGGARLPVVAVTANALQSETERCLAAGMDDFLSKPLEMERLRRVLARWLPAAGRPALLPPLPPPPLLPAAAPLPAAPPTLDPEALVRVFGEDREAIREILVDFIPPSRGIVAAIEAAGLADIAALGREAHKLKSAARAIGAMRLAVICEALELAAKRDDASGVAAALPGLRPSFQAVLDSIAELAGPVPSPSEENGA